MSVDGQQFTTIGEYVFVRVTEHDWSYRTLGRKLGVHHSTIGHWVAGRAKPLPGNLVAMAELFGDDLDMLQALAGHRRTDKTPEQWEKDKRARTAQAAVNELREALALDDILDLYLTEHADLLAPEDAATLERLRDKYRND